MVFKSKEEIVKKTKLLNKYQNFVIYEKSNRRKK
jgi:hypothetical protein